MRHKRLQAARRAAGFSAMEAATLLNKSISTIKGWESLSGHSPRMDDVVKICDLYKISIDWYATGQGVRRAYLEDDVLWLRRFHRLSGKYQHVVKNLISGLEAVEPP